MHVNPKGDNQKDLLNLTVEKSDLSAESAYALNKKRVSSNRVPLAEIN